MTFSRICCSTCNFSRDPLHPRILLDREGYWTARGIEPKQVLVSMRAQCLCPHCVHVERSEIRAPLARFLFPSQRKGE